MSTRMVSTGRGGSGNMHPCKSNPSPKLIPQGSQTPSILQPVYSTGRGGAGNMRRNVDPRMTRKAQDVEQFADDEDAILVGDEDYIGPLPEENISNTLSGANSRSASSGGSRGRLAASGTRRGSNVSPSGRERPKAIVLGRGGAGNIISPTSSSKERKKKKNSKKDGHKNSGVWSSVKHFFS
ncbi:PAR32 (YDL173W) [Zygosaccharomyces parabailii]|uniref:ZYBA0S10-02498g1_1 n=1 Tax=Zygosaccharomyces bailii (strain CLIB 213 / ATCC 58445 / CBS 680 / BCRC 21525 / NBRC 1098 / NCYC 1416 / NRRL Y-2227) TaxID=1333698 RepID=A0A8J2X9Z8_ZYGB2|nr:PAR32 (YDL173W) [Zygosaccharomyces parabailii]CDF91224.1 ZYBA0S10-02498g1_1 [Zygosaccharomyces bailii CLIB 213]CDH16994.1 uncharacterized protein ZBAI_08782 [Zygosaccharomyces bailii ISA1307]SJM88252.1 uncharacterized protein ZBIST_4441 [Zygosaccharomyces bailii]